MYNVQLEWNFCIHSATVLSYASVDSLAHAEAPNISAFATIYNIACTVSKRKFRIEDEWKNDENGWQIWVNQTFPYYVLATNNRFNDVYLR